MSGRSNSVDVARGSLMLYIVLVIHGMYWVGFFSSGFRSFFLFEMPVVFLISGYSYFLYERAVGEVSPAKNFPIYLRFIQVRFLRILIPYYAYALMCFLFCCLYYYYQGQESWSLGGYFWAWFNPFVAGGDRSYGMLSWHLWFVGPMLLVSAMLPAIARIRFRLTLPLWVWFVAAYLVVLLVCQRMLGDFYLPRVTLFYLLWAGYGYALASNKEFQGVVGYIGVFVLAAAALFVLHAFVPNSFIFDMQKNKFPPNAAFFAFGCAWVSFLMLWMPRLSGRFIDRLASSWWLKPFIASGYSIYLWQGVGYTVSVHFGQVFGFPKIVILISSLILSVLLGVVFSPLERIRLR